MDEDYFGDIAVPDDEKEEDAANDTTFGDIGDIKAGDDASDALWKPGHQQISSKIEAEKETLQKQLGNAREAPLRSPNNVTEGNGHHFRDPMPTPPKGSWEQPLPLRQLANQQQMPQQHLHSQLPYLQNSLTQPMQIAEQIQRLNNQAEQLKMSKNQAEQLLQNQATLFSQTTIPPLRTASQLPHMSPLPQMPQMPPVAQAAQGTQTIPSPQNLPPQYRNLGQQAMAPQEYQQRMMAYLENHTRELLMRHKETAEVQLREAEAAQRIGVLFDRNKFDEHQNAVRQRILSEHYSRVSQLRFAVWQQSQQLSLLDPGASERSRTLAATASEGNKAPATEAGSVLDRMPKAQSNANGNAKGADDLLAVMQDALRMDATRTQTTTKEPFPNQNRRVRRDKSEKPQRLLEIERQMAEAGLGPTKNRGSRERSRHRGDGGIRQEGRHDGRYDGRYDGRHDGRQESRQKSHQEGGGRQVTKKKERRLESMTEKDQELVFRVHLRQVESSVVYKDDYYNAVLKKKVKLGETDVYADLAEKVRMMRQFAREHGGEGRSGRGRRSKRATANGEQSSTSSPLHSDQNMKALATALGTVQSWNPRAPRRVMDFGVMQQGSKENEEGMKLLRDDERVHVKQEIERGYDIIATIHDIARGESSESLEDQIRGLISTLHIADAYKSIEKKKHSSEKTRSFATLCVTTKGREYLGRVIDLLDNHERAMVLQAAYETLGSLLFSLEKASTSSGSPVQSGLLTRMFKTVQDPEVSSRDCLGMLNSFISSHVSHRDALLTTFRSARGSKLIFLCMQRISRGFHKQEIREADLSNALMERFSEVFTGCLQDIFDGAESVTSVWEVTASLDGLALGDHRAKYRAELNNLLRSGAAPPPPGAKSTQQQQ